MSASSLLLLLLLPSVNSTGQTCLIAHNSCYCRHPWQSSSPSCSLPPDRVLLIVFVILLPLSLLSFCHYYYAHCFIRLYFLALAVLLPDWRPSWLFLKFIPASYIPLFIHPLFLLLLPRIFPLSPASPPASISWSWCLSLSLVLPVLVVYDHLTPSLSFLPFVIFCCPTPFCLLTMAPGGGRDFNCSWEDCGKVRF